MDESTIQIWVTATLSSLLTERTRVTTFVPVLTMRDIRTLAEQHQQASTLS